MAKPESSNKQHLIKSDVMLIAIKIAREQAWPLLNYVGSVSFFLFSCKMIHNRSLSNSWIAN